MTTKLDRAEYQMFNAVSEKKTYVRAYSAPPPVNIAVEAAVKTIAKNMDIMDRKRMIAQLYITFSTDLVLQVLFRLDEQGITIPSISESK